VVVLLAVLVGVVVTRPAEFTVTRSRELVAAPEVVFGYIDDLHRWVQWSPWEKRDPGMKREYSGAAAGSGAVYAWAGNQDIGEGRMTITESRPNERIAIRLEFMKPMAATNEVEFTLTPSGSGTTVRWSMTGKNGFVGKAISLFMDMDTMVGHDFETGLSQLDTATAAEAKAGA
jgi:uncharacterized protein YndB with AHSA1/START domain